MKLSEIKSILGNLNTIAFQLPNGKLVPSHFHVTEVGKITKNFIDCGGTVRKEEVVNFQLWDSTACIQKNWFILLNYRKRCWKLGIWKLKWNTKEIPYKNLDWTLTVPTFFWPPNIQIVWLRTTVGFLQKNRE